MLGSCRTKPTDATTESNTMEVNVLYEPSTAVQNTQAPQEPPSMNHDPATIQTILPTTMDDISARPEEVLDLCRGSIIKPGL